MGMLLNRFEWDERTLTYQPAPLRAADVWRTLRRKTIWGIVGGLLLLGLTNSHWERFYTRIAERQRQALLQEKHLLERQLIRYQVQMQQLHQRMQRLYRPIAGLPPLPTEVWEGGMGGAPVRSMERMLYQSRLLLSEYGILQARISEQLTHVAYVPCIAPISGPIVSHFGMRRDPFHGAWQMHTGLDFSAPYGAPVRVTADGRVRFAGWDGGGYGLQVEVDHTNGLVTKYAHLSRLAVTEGQKVKRGQIIGYVGSTGYSIAPHLHYEVMEFGMKVNPEKYLYLP